MTDNQQEEADYSQYEGKEIKCTFTEKGVDTHYIGIVAGFDYDIGMTIMNKEDHNDYLWCILGPSSPNFPKNRLEEYQEHFDFALACIKQGYYTYKEDPDLSCDLAADIPSIDHCPFNQ